MKRLVVVAAFAMGAVVATAPTSGAVMTYCDWDPLVVVVTPGGHVAVVYDSVWTPSLLNLGIPLESYTTQRVYLDGAPATEVDMTISVPTGLLFRYQTYDAVTTGLLGSGKQLAGGYGSSGSATHLKFILPES